MSYTIGYAQTVLSWQENLSSDEMPPEWMWTLDHELEIWFERLSDERKQKYSGDSSESGLMENELAAETRKRR